MRRKNSLKRSIQELRNFQKTLEGSSERAYIQTIVNRLEYDLQLIEEELDEAKMIGLRGPSFEDDMVGWLADDFDEPDRVERLIDSVESLKRAQLEARQQNDKLIGMLDELLKRLQQGK